MGSGSGEDTDGSEIPIDGEDEGPPVVSDVCQIREEFDDSRILVASLVVSVPVNTDQFSDPLKFDYILLISAVFQ